jgi:hypothetical protein
VSGGLFKSGAWLGDGSAGYARLSSSARHDLQLSLACYDTSCAGPQLIDLERPPPSPAVVEAPSPLIGQFALLGVGPVGRQAGSSLVLGEADAVLIYYPLRFADGTVPLWPGALSQSVLIDMPPNERLGSAAAIGDLDGDGVGDLAIGAPTQRGGAGVVYIVSGAALPANGVFELHDSSTRVISGMGTEALGSSLAIVPTPTGNVLAVGARYQGGDQGLVYVIQPQPGEVSSQSATLKIIGSWSSHAFGALAVDDFDGSGPTLAVGVPGESAVVLVHLSGLASGVVFSLEPGTVLDGRVAGAGNFGATLATGLLRGSSTRMLAVGAPSADKVYVFEGGTVKKWSAPAWTFNGRAGTQFGGSVAFGKPDSTGGSLFIGAPASSPLGRNGAGAAYLFHGSAVGNPGQMPSLGLANAALVAWGVHDQDGAGAAVALGGFDVSDGLDVMFLANNSATDDAGGSHDGAVYGIKGVPSP